MSQNTKDYLPLNGEELKEWILFTLRQQMGQDDRFRQHIVYHNPLLHAKMEISTYTAEGKELESKTTMEIGGYKETAVGGEVPRFARPNRLQLDLSTEKPLLEPDRAREEVGLATYEVQKKADVLVDVPIKPKNEI